jgi:methylglutaconyl-CoA hydratase
MSYDTLLLGFEADVATLTLSRPQKRNAISREMVGELLSALDEIEKGPARALILTGAGQAFCAGMDLGYLKEFPAQSPDEIRLDARRIAALFRRLWSFPKPTVAAVNGAAVAGGCALATFTDFTFAAPEATFGYTEVRVGFIPAVVSCFVVRQVGEKRARELLLSGRVLGTPEATAYGLVTETVPAGKLMARAREHALSLAAMSPTALAFTKRLLVQYSEPEIERDLELAVDSSVRIRQTGDFREGLAAFLEKRKPVWRGE